VLIVLPILVLAVLLQSAFWVPTYENQTTGNPDRLRKFISAGIGDARVLNPVLSADGASSEVVGYVFDALLDLDEQLRPKPSLARAWNVTEEAYLVVRPDRRITPERLRLRIRAALESGALAGSADLVEAIEIVPAAAESRPETVPIPQEDGPPRFEDVVVEVAWPARLRFQLREVVPDWFEQLRPVLGADYFAGWDGSERVTLPEGPAGEVLAASRAEFLPLEEHNPVFRFELRRGVTFHDGHPFEASDVRFTWEAILDPKNASPRTSDFEPIKAVEVLDPHTVRVVYKRLFAPAIYAWTYMGILPEHLQGPEALAREMDARGIEGEARESFGLRQSRFVRDPVGTGPFRFVSWQSDDLIHVRRNDAYWEGPAEYEDVYMRVIPDLLTQELEFRAGAIDLFAPQAHQVERYRDDPRYQSFASIGFGYSYIGYNARKPPFDDARVRRALGMAIDVDQIIDFVISGEGERITGPYGVTTQWYDADVPPIPFDPEGALEILHELGWKENGDGLLERDGKVFEFNLLTNNGNPERKAIVTIAQNAWSRLGIKVNVRLLEWAVFLNDFVNVGKFDAVVLGWSLGVDPDLYQLWHSSQTGNQQLNFTAFIHPEADRLIEAIRVEYDAERQRELAHELHRLIAQEQPYTFLYARRATRVLDRKIVMVEREPDGSERIVPVRPSPTGSLKYYFRQWRKLAQVPSF